MAGFGIMGGGAWGTALGQSLASGGRSVLLWAREPEVVESIRERRENALFLPGVPLAPSLGATGRLEDLGACDVLFLVAPVQHLRAVTERLAPVVASGKAPPTLVLASKGIEQGSLALPAAIVAATLPACPVAVLSGPTFALEVAQGLPTALTLACADPALGRRLAEAISGPALRPYTSEDLAGVQIGGAIKNVLAIACGISAGCGLGDNTRAAIITRGLAELARLGLALGGREETFMGLSGLGDLVLTCSSPQSRNMSLGMALGRGESLKAILASRSSVAEGVPTAPAARALAARHGVDMPIVAAVDSILNHGADVAATVAALLARPLRPERNGEAAWPSG